MGNKNKSRLTTTLKIEHKQRVFTVVLKGKVNCLSKAKIIQLY